jgi:ribose transport system permease protein
MANPTLAAEAADSQDAGGGGRKRQLERRRHFAERLQGQGLLLILAIVIVLMWTQSPYFMTVDNLFTAASVVSILGIMAVAETVWVAVAISLLLAAGIGMINGALTVLLKVNSLVVTLGMYSIVLGVAYVLSDSTTVVIDGSGFDWLGSADIWRIPVPVFFFAGVWIIGQFVLRATALGRHVYAVGDNTESAIRAGVRADLLRIGLFMAMSLSACLAGIIVTSQLSSAAPQIGDPYLLSVVTAVILGGTSLAGGRGTLRGTLIAIAILGVLQNGFALLQYSVYTEYIVQGGLLIFAVLTDQLVRRAER